jgi:hypothetical protein
MSSDFFGRDLGGPITRRLTHGCLILLSTVKHAAVTLFQLGARHICTTPLTKTASQIRYKITTSTTVPPHHWTPQDHHNRPMGWTNYLAPQLPAPQCMSGIVAPCGPYTTVHDACILAKSLAAYPISSPSLGNSDTLCHAASNRRTL